MITFNSIAQKMNETGILPSVQRIEIMDYLYKHQGHPTAEQIFKELKQKGIHISKATVYNTLKLFEEKGLVRVLTMEDNENRFDIITHDHGHFICETCGAIFDFAVQAAPAADMGSGALKDCAVRQRDVYFKGVCSKCLNK
jgi:Fe2+ or Zn2+ uptake regulation protein